MSESPKAWLLLSKEVRQHGGNLGYDDQASDYYSWDSTVANHSLPKLNDRIVIWDGETILGASVIQNLETSSGTKKRLRCPKCNMTKIKSRLRVSPSYRCHIQSCKCEFNTPSIEDIEVKTYKSYHGDFWQNLNGEMNADQLRSVCIQPRSQFSIRPLNWREFKQNLAQEFEHNLQTVDDIENDKSGRKISKTFVRVGQRKFRKQLLKTYGNVCAFSGLNHSSGLDAAHLYSYATLEMHDYYGGLLLRKDLHRLFDLGMIAINPENLCLHLSPSLRKIPQYSEMHGSCLKVNIQDKTLQWLKVHWQEHKDFIEAQE